MAGVAYEPCDPGHNGSQRVTNLAKTYICRVSVGHKAPQESQILMEGVAQEPCDLGHNGSQQVTNLAKSYIRRVLVGHLWVTNLAKTYNTGSHWVHT